jgi:hypothetical protein
LTSKYLRAFGAGRRWASVSARSTYSSTPLSPRLARLPLHPKSLGLCLVHHVGLAAPRHCPPQWGQLIRSTLPQPLSQSRHRSPAHQ